MNLNRVKYNNNLINLIANIDLNMRKIMKHEKYSKKKKTKKKKDNSLYLPKKKGFGRINCQKINLMQIKKK